MAGNAQTQLKNSHEHALSQQYRDERDAPCVRMGAAVPVSRVVGDGDPPCFYYSGHGARQSGSHTQLARFTFSPSVPHTAMPHLLETCMHHLAAITSDEPTDAAMLTLIALHRQSGGVVLSAANVGTNRVMIAYRSRETGEVGKDTVRAAAWTVLRLLPEHRLTDSNADALRIQYARERLTPQTHAPADDATSLTAARALGGRAHDRVGLSHGPQSISLGELPEEMDVLIWVADGRWARHVQEADVAQLLQSLDPDSRLSLAELAQQAISNLVLLNPAPHGDPNARVDNALLTCMPVSPKIPDKTVVIQSVCLAEIGPTAARAIEANLTSVCQRVMDNAKASQANALPRLTDRVRLECFAPRVEQKIGAIQVALLQYDRLITQERQRFPHRYLPSWGPSATEHEKQRVIEQLTTFMNVLNTQLSPATAESVNAIETALLEFERVLLNTTWPQRMKTVAWKLLTIVFYTAMSLVMLTRLPTLGYTFPTFEFYALLMTGSAALTSLPAVLTLLVGGGTLCYRTHEAFFKTTPADAVKVALADFRDEIRSVMTTFSQ